MCFIGHFFLWIALALCSVAPGRCSLYSNAENSPVAELTPSDFQSQVIGAASPVLVHFFYPYSPVSKSVAPEFDKAAAALSTNLKGYFKFAAVDLSVYPEIGRKYGTTFRGDKEGIRFFGIRRESPIEYSGESLAKSILSFGFEHAKTLAYYRVGLVKMPKNKPRNDF